MSRITLFDRFVNYLDPVRGQARFTERRRQEFSEKRAEVTRMALDRRRREYAAGGGFQSAENSRDAASWLTSNLSPTSALEQDRPTMIERADSAVKNFELGTAHVENRVVRVVGCGFTIQPELDFEEIGMSEDEAEKHNQKLRKGWERLVERIGKHGEWLYEQQQLCQRYWERRGEFFVLFGDEYDALSPVTLKTEVIHPDRVSSPPSRGSVTNDSPWLGDDFVRMGIQLDAIGRAIGCYVQDCDPGDTVQTKQTWTYYQHVQSNGLPRMFHHFDRRDARQYRGYPRMQVGTKQLKNVEEYVEAEIERNYVAACHAAIIRTEMPAEDAMGATGAVEDANGKRVREIQPSMFHYVGTADEVTLSNPSGAPVSFEQFVKSRNRAFAAGCGTPYEMLTGDWGNLAYNAARIIWNMDEAAVDVAQMGHFKFILAAYAHYITRMIVTGEFTVDPIEFRSQPWVYWACRVIPPARASIDPAREDRNDLVMVEAGVIPHSDVVERKTGEPADKIYKRIKPNRKAMEAAGLDPHMPNMGRDEGTGTSPTQPGDSNQASSDANSDRQAVGA